MINSDPASHRGQRDVVCRSWLGTEVVVGDGCTCVRTDACGLAPVIAGDSLDTSAPPQRTPQESTPMDLFDGSQWFALQGQTLDAAVVGSVRRGAYLFTSWRSRVLRKDRARSGVIPFQRNVFVLAQVAR